jgi:hypothetical protein
MPTAPSTTAAGQNRMPRYGTIEKVAKALAVPAKPVILFFVLGALYFVLLLGSENRQGQSTKHKEQSST